MPRRVVRRKRARSAKKVSNVKRLFHVQETHLNPYDFVLIGFLLLIGLYLLSLGLGGTGASISPITLGVTGAATAPTGYATAPPIKWWDTNWNYRIPVKVKEIAGIDHNDYIVEATVDTTSLINAGKLLQANCGDIRVVGENNVVYDNEIDSTYHCDRTDTKVRFRTNVTSNFDGTIAYIYYGNKDANALGVTVPWWKEKTKMPTGRILMNSGTVGNKIYVLGGEESISGSVTLSSRNDIYDTATDTWASGTAMPKAKFDLGAEVLGGRVYIFGGQSSNAIVKGTDSYVAVSDQWSAKSDMLLERTNFGTATLNGKIYAFGGWDNNDNILDTNNVYDSNSDSWSAKAAMPVAGYGLAGVGVNTTNLYAIGLSASGSDTRNLVYTYNAQTDAWKQKAQMPTGRIKLSVVSVDNKIYAIGGFAVSSGRTTAVEIYDPATDKWVTGPSLPKARGRHTSQVVNGKIYVFGGDTPDAAFTDNTLEYSVPNWKLNVSGGAEEGPDTTAPSFSNLSQTSNATTAGKLMRFSVIWSDVSSPLQVWFYDSYTGKNSSAQPANSGQKTTYEFDTTGIPDNSYVRWKSYAQDDAGNIGVSNELSFLVTGGPVAPQPNVTENVTQPTTPGADTEDPTSSEILLLPTTIDPGMEALIRVRVADNEGLKEAILKVDGDEVETVPLAGTRDTAEFTWKPDTASKYELEVLIKDVAGNEESVSKTVQVGKVAETPKGDSTVFIALGFVLLVIAAVIVLYYLKKKGKLNFGKKKGGEEEEELTAEELGLEGPKY